MSAEEAAFYRQRAREMRKQSARALSRELQDSYLAIAADWDRVAKQLEEAPAAPGTPSPRVQTENSPDPIPKH